MVKANQLTNINRIIKKTEIITQNKLLNTLKKQTETQKQKNKTNKNNNIYV